MKDPMTIVDRELDLIDAMKRLVTSPAWAQYAIFLRTTRKEILQDKVNAAVRSGEIVKAQIELALMDAAERDAKLFVESISQREYNLKKGRTK